MDAYTIQLCREYIETVDAMRSGRYSTEEIHQLDSQRLLLHDELCNLLRVDRKTDMYRRARAVLMAARGSNLQ